MKTISFECYTNGTMIFNADEILGYLNAGGELEIYVKGHITPSIGLFHSDNNIKKLEKLFKS